MPELTGYVTFLDFCSLSQRRRPLFHRSRSGGLQYLPAHASSSASTGSRADPFELSEYTSFLPSDSFGVTARIPWETSIRSRSDRTFVAIPAIALSNSVNESELRRVNSRAINNVQLSPKDSAALSKGETAEPIRIPLG